MDDAGGILFLLVYLAFIVLILVSNWIVFTKAGQPGWGIFIPIFNVYLLLNIAGMSGWWLVALFIPILNILPFVLIPLGIARNFGKGVGFGVGLMFLPFIFYPILAFGDAEYAG